MPVEAGAVSSPQFLCHFPLQERGGTLVVGAWPTGAVASLYTCFFLYFSLSTDGNGSCSAALGLMLPS